MCFYTDKKKRIKTKKYLRIVFSNKFLCLVYIQNANEHILGDLCGLFEDNEYLHTERSRGTRIQNPQIRHSQHVKL